VSNPVFAFPEPGSQMAAPVFYHFGLYRFTVMAYQLSID
jgi:hypothetical protein